MKSLTDILDAELWCLDVVIISCYKPSGSCILNLLFLTFLSSLGQLWLIGLIMNCFVCGNVGIFRNSVNNQTSFSRLIYINT